MPVEMKRRKGAKTHIPQKGKGTKYKIVCSNCEAVDKVPFKPQSRKVLCSRCFRDRKYLD